MVTTSRRAGPVLSTYSASSTSATAAHVSQPIPLRFGPFCSSDMASSFLLAPHPRPWAFCRPCLPAARVRGAPAHLHLQVPVDRKPQRRPDAHHEHQQQQDEGNGKPGRPAPPPALRVLLVRHGTLPSPPQSGPAYRRPRRRQKAT